MTQDLKQPRPKKKERSGIRTITNGIRSMLIGLVMFGGLELLLYRPTAIWWVLFVLVSITFIVLLTHGSRAWRNIADRHVMILALVLTAGSVVFLLFPAGRIIQHVAAIILSIAIGGLIFLLRRPIDDSTSAVQYKPSEAFILLAAFLLFTDIAGLSLFFAYWKPEWNFALMLLALIGAAVGLGYQFFVFQDIPRKRIPIHLALLGLLIGETGWALAFWPTDAFSRGAVLFVVFYLFAGLSKHAVQKSFTWRICGEYMATSAVLLTLMLATTQWTF